MASKAETKKIVRGYHDAWLESKDLELARSFLAADLNFRGSLFSQDDRESFLESLSGLLPVMTAVHLLDEFYDENRAILFYDLETSTLAGSMRIAEHFRVENGKIKEMKLVFDATEMRKMMNQMAEQSQSQPAYFVSFVQFEESERFMEYSQVMMAAMMKYEALPIAHIDPAGVVPSPLPQAEVIEGHWPGITSVVKFASMAQLKAFCASNEFKRASDFRKQIATSKPGNCGRDGLAAWLTAVAGVQATNIKIKAIHAGNFIITNVRATRRVAPTSNNRQSLIVI